MPRTTSKICFSKSSFGTEHSLNVHRFHPKLGQPTRRAYIQASLHADEYPGMLVANHLCKLLEDADIKEEIIIIPFANPIGLSQRVLGNHLGRFSAESGINFNRDWFNFTDQICDTIKDKLCSDETKNVSLIREAILTAVEKHSSSKEEVCMKKALYELAAVSDIVLDLHCDSEGILIS